MTIDAAAIDRIVELSKTYMQDDMVATPAFAIVPSTMTVRDLESFLPTRRRFRGVFTTAYAKHFVAYIKAAGYGAPPVFVDADNAAAVCVLDFGDPGEPGHCDHVAKLKLHPTALWSAVLEIRGRPVTQRYLAEWLEDWRHYLVPVDAVNVPIDIAKAIAAVRKIDIKATAQQGSEVGTMSETRSALAKVEASSTEGLPARFHVKVKPYAELPMRDAALELSVITGDEPRLKLRMIAFEEHIEEIGEDFAEFLIELLPEGARPLLGTFTGS